MLTVAKNAAAFRNYPDLKRQKKKLVTPATTAARVFAAGIVPSLAYQAELGPYPRDFVRHVRAKALWAHG